MGRGSLPDTQSKHRTFNVRQKRRKDRGGTQATCEQRIEVRTYRTQHRDTTLTAYYCTVNICDLVLRLRIFNTVVKNKKMISIPISENIPPKGFSAVCPNVLL